MKTKKWVLHGPARLRLKELTTRQAGESGDVSGPVESFPDLRSLACARQAGSVIRQVPAGRGSARLLSPSW